MYQSSKLGMSVRFRLPALWGCLDLGTWCEWLANSLQNCFYIGSNPIVPSHCGNSSTGRAWPCQGRGCGFESRFPLQILYKMVKRRITIEWDDDLSQTPLQAPQFGEYGRHIPALTVPTRAEHPCIRCQNNPVNNPNASGICDCVLPSMWQTIY